MIAYTAATNRCSCEAPYIVYNEECVPKANCNDNETYHSETNSCTCDAPYMIVNGGQCKEKDALIAGDIILFGHYEQDDDPGTKDEPIEWRVLSHSGNTLYVISEKALDVQNYNNMNYYTYINKTPYPMGLFFLDSTIRSWLNGFDGSKNVCNTDYSGAGKSFKSNAFTIEEQSKISEIKLIGDGDLDTYFPNNEGIAAYATKYVANKLGTKYCCSYPCTVHWWRYGSKYDKNGYPYIIASPGSSAMICNTENCSTSGYVATVRPVMYIYL